MITPASVKRHPIHPMLVPFPIGLWVFSLISDIIFTAGWGGAVWRMVAFYTMAGGVIGALCAAVPGLIDLLSIENQRTKTIAIWHMVLNLVAVILFAVNIWLRTRGAAESTTLYLSILGIVVICISGWLGGELVYARGVGVEQTAKQ